MSRKFNSNKKINILPDLKFNSVLIAKLINLVMVNGKKTIAKCIVYYSLNLLSKKINKSHLDSLNEVLNNLRPNIEIKSRKIGGSVYRIPVEVKFNRGNTLAMKWIVYFAKNRNESNHMKIKLYNELIDVINNKGESIKKRNEIYKIANSNKAFAHYKW